MFSGFDSSRVYGTASSSSRLKVAQDLFKHLFVTGFNKDSTPEYVMQHLQDNKIRFRFVKKILCKVDDKRASFKLTVPISAYEHVFSSNAWPVGIYVKEFSSVLRPNKLFVFCIQLLPKSSSFNKFHTFLT